jgi:hypothetical protein
MFRKGFSIFMNLIQNNSSKIAALELLKREVLSCDGTNTSGVERLATYLRLLNADHQQLLFEYSPLVLQSNMELGVMVSG